MTVRLASIPTNLESGLFDFLRSVRDAIELRDGLTGDKAAAFIAKSDITIDWMNPALLDGWQRYAETQEAPAFFKSLDGVVYLKGTVASGTTGATARVFILPQGSRPAYKMVFPAMTNTGIGQVDIEPTGEVRPVSGGTTWFSLNGISFIAGVNT